MKRVNIAKLAAQYRGTDAVMPFAWHVARAFGSDIHVSKESSALVEQICLSEGFDPRTGEKVKTEKSIPKSKGKR